MSALQELGVVSIDQLLDCTEADLQALDWTGYWENHWATKYHPELKEPNCSVEAIKTRLDECRFALRTA